MPSHPGILSRGQCVNYKIPVTIQSAPTFTGYAEEKTASLHYGALEDYLQPEESLVRVSFSLVPVLYRAFLLLVAALGADYGYTRVLC